ncbi:MAG: YibE/F family protein [Anaerobutyricum sp.]|nr:YibE/F family protein [Eubacterium sp.]MDY6047343.1 YibE/F family protein [Anaerobutyricum sp.]
MLEELKKTGIKTIAGRGCLAIAGILFLLFLYRYSQIDKVILYETEGRTFAKAEVMDVIEDNETEDGISIGNQIVSLKLTSGKWKGKTVEATSSSSYLYGAHCKKGSKVIAIVSESQGEMTASVYSQNREMQLYLIIAIFVFTIILIGGKKGLASVIGLGFTILCILFLFLPMIYKGISPIWSAVLVVILTTVATMYLVGGISRKTMTAILGTVSGVLISALFAMLFCKMTNISGYNVSDIEDLIYIRDQTGIKVGELLFSGILISALGAVMDVAMSISSTIEEIHCQNSELTIKELFQSGMNVGKDMMGTMSNTLILAFAGGSINTLVFIFAYNYEYLQVVNMYAIGIEIIQGIASSMGVILTVPITSFLAAWEQGKKTI